MKAVYTVDANDQKQGQYESFYDNGQLKRKGAYKKDLEDGSYVEYDQNGNIVDKGVYKNDEKIFSIDKGHSGVVAKLDSVNKLMKPTQLRQSAKRNLVAEYRKRHPKSHSR